jgi:primosomal replication protein N
MQSLSCLILIGHVGRTPVLADPAGGTAMCYFDVAVHEGPQNEFGKRTVVWYHVEAAGDLGINAANRLQKGSYVYVEGQLKTARLAKQLAEHGSISVLCAAFEQLEEQGVSPAVHEGDYGPYGGELCVATCPRCNAEFMFEFSNAPADLVTERCDECGALLPLHELTFREADDDEIAEFSGERGDYDYSLNGPADSEWDEEDEYNEYDDDSDADDDDDDPY